MYVSVFRVSHKMSVGEELITESLRVTILLRTSLGWSQMYISKLNLVLKMILSTGGSD